MVANEANRIEYRRGQLVEWYRNDENGLEQGFTLSSPPQGEGFLQLDLVIKGDLVPQLSAEENEIVLQDERSTRAAALWFTVGGRRQWPKPAFLVFLGRGNLVAGCRRRSRQLTPSKSIRP